MEFTGISAHKGIVQGQLCIVHKEDEFSHCQNGDVVLLVGVKPQIGLVKKASALLAIHGGITSHAAIAARENNKPAVVGLQEYILKMVKNGDQVEVDGEKGIVTKI